MALKVSCPNCLSLLQVPRKLRGRVVVCPCCKEKCQVPMPSTVGVPPAAVHVQQHVAAEAHATPYDPARGSWIRMAVVASIAAAVVAVGGLIFSAVINPRRAAEQVQPPEPPPVVPLAPNGDGQTTDPSAPPAPGNADLAKQAEHVLRAHCYRCHGEEGSNEGGFNFVLRRERLIADQKKYINLNTPGESFLLQRIADGEMPPDGEKPSKSEVDVLRRWIAQGAPDFAPPLSRPFLTNADLVRFIRNDLEKEVSPRHQAFTRYFTLVNLYNAGFSDDEMETYRLALSKLVNSLSWHNKVVPPRPIDPHKTIFRVDIRDLGWDDGVWQAIVDANPYSVKMNEEDSDSAYCLSKTDCRVPHVRGDWFVAAGSRPPLYHTVLQVPETLNDLIAKRFPGVDLEKDIEKETVVRAGFNRSGVSTNNRLLEWHHSPHGYLWVSYDFAANADRKNLFRHPMGPGKGAQDFEHDGGEIIFSLPNHLQGYMLVDAAGKRIDKGPPAIVSDPKRPDRAVTNGVSCMSCHYGGIIKKDDEIRAVVEANPLGFRGSYDKIMELYKPKKELDELYTENAARFRQAMSEVGIDNLTETGEPIVNMAQRFESEVDIRSAAAELGLELERFKNALQNNPRVQDKLGQLNVPGGTVKRDLFAKEFVSVMEELRLGTGIAKTNPPQVASTTGDKPTTVEKPTESPKPDPTPTVTPGNGTSTPTPNPQMRVWLDTKTKVSLEAEFVNLDGKNVELRKADGTPVQIPLANLGPADRKFVQDRLAGVEIPPGPPPGGEQIGGPTPTNGGRPLPPPPPPGPEAPVARVWRNLHPMFGKVVRASFVSLVKGDIKLSDADKKGVIITWPMQDMCPEDHEYVKGVVGEDHFKRHKDLPDGLPPPQNPLY